MALFSASLSAGNLKRTIAIGGLKAIYGNTQKLGYTQALTLFLLKSSGVNLIFNSLPGANIQLSAPIGLIGTGLMNINLAGFTTVTNNYTLGNPALVTGCGW